MMSLHGRHTRTIVCTKRSQKAIRELFPECVAVERQSVRNINKQHAVFQSFGPYSYVPGFSAEPFCQFSILDLFIVTNDQSGFVHRTGKNHSGQLDVKNAVAVIFSQSWLLQ